jgi:hypothetical protein
LSGPPEHGNSLAALYLRERDAFFEDFFAAFFGAGFFAGAFFAGAFFAADFFAADFVVADFFAAFFAGFFFAVFFTAFFATVLAGDFFKASATEPIADFTVPATSSAIARPYPTFSAAFSTSVLLAIFEPPRVHVRTQ